MLDYNRNQAIGQRIKAQNPFYKKIAHFYTKGSSAASVQTHYSAQGQSTG